MKILVEQVWAGKLKYQITMPDGKREVVNCEQWDIEARREALDLLEHVYKLKRRNIRFEVK